MKKSKNLKINIVLLILIFLIVIFFSLKDNFYETIKCFLTINIIWFSISIIFMILNVLFQSLSLFNLIKKVKEDFKFKKALYLTLAGLFFNGITPFSSGGQPFQVYLMKKEGIRVSDSGNILLQNFITFQLSLILIGTISIILNYSLGIFPQENLLKKAVFIGYLVNVIVLSLLFILVYAKKFNLSLFDKILNFIFKFIKNKENLRKKIDDTLNNFYGSSSNIKNNLNKFILSLVFNSLSLLCLYIIPLFLFYSLGDYNSLNVLKSIVSSGYTFLIGSFVPIPGGSGGLEYSFTDFFKTFQTGGFLSAVLLLWRFITYYLAMIVGAITLIINKKEE